MQWIDEDLSDYSSLIKFIGQTPNEKSKPKPKINSNFQRNCTEVGRRKVEGTGDNIVTNIFSSGKNKITYTFINKKYNKQLSSTYTFDNNCKIILVE